jgi:hypothetical protein
MLKKARTDLEAAVKSTMNLEEQARYEGSAFQASVFLAQLFLLDRVQGSRPTRSRPERRREYASDEDAGRGGLEPAHLGDGEDGQARRRDRAARLLAKKNPTRTRSAAPPASSPRARPPGAGTREGDKAKGATPS